MHLITKREKIKYEIDGKCYPSVTTIIGEFTGPFLIGWANKVGREGRTTQEASKPGQDIGLLTHALIECYLKGIKEYEIHEYFTKEVIQCAQVCCAEFCKWWESWFRPGWRIMDQEFSMVDKGLGYGGTLDIAVDTVKGCEFIIDIKTSNSVYESTWAQVAAYRKIYNRVALSGNELEIKGVIVNVDKEGFRDVIFISERQMKYGWHLFRHLFGAYKMKQKLAHIRSLQNEKAKV